MFTGCFETRVKILNGSQNLTNETNGLIFVLNCRQIVVSKHPVNTIARATAHTLEVYTMMLSIC